MLAKPEEFVFSYACSNVDRRVTLFLVLVFVLKNEKSRFVYSFVLSLCKTQAKMDESAGFKGYYQDPAIFGNTLVCL
jgi:hypothetical protein